MTVVSLEDLGSGSVDLSNKSICEAAGIEIKTVPESRLPILKGNDLFYRIIPHRVRELSKEHDTILIPDHGMMAGVNPRKYGVEIVPIVHDLDKFHRRNGNLIQRFNIVRSVRNLENTDKMVAISEQTKEEILRETNIPEQNIHVVKQGFDNSKMYRDESELETNVEKPYVLYIGALMDRKNPEFLLEVLDFLPEEYMLVVAGNSYEDRNMRGLQKKAECKEFQNSVIFTGYVSLPELRRLYSHACVYLHPARYEGYGRTPVEAAMTGTLPILYSKLPCATDLKDVAITFDAFEPEDVAELIVENAGRSVSYEARSWEEAAEELREVLEDG